MPAHIIGYRLSMYPIICEKKWGSFFHHLVSDLNANTATTSLEFAAVLIHASSHSAFWLKRKRHFLRNYSFFSSVLLCWWMSFGKCFANVQLLFKDTKFSSGKPDTSVRRLLIYQLSLTYIYMITCTGKQAFISSIIIENASWKNYLQLLWEKINLKLNFCA